MDCYGIDNQSNEKILQKKFQEGFCISKKVYFCAIKNGTLP